MYKQATDTSACKSLYSCDLIRNSLTMLLYEGSLSNQLTRFKVHTGMGSVLHDYLSARVCKVELHVFEGTFGSNQLSLQVLHVIARGDCALEDSSRL